jgi:alanine racemase
MTYQTEQLAGLLGASEVRFGKAGAVSQLLIDSRLLQGPARTLFFAVVGPVRDGHDYITELYEQGVRHFVVQQLPAGDREEANFFVVPNTVAALQRLAAQHRLRFDLPVVGITGSNGKTIVKEWLFQLLHPDYRICRSPKSYNSQIGLPLSLWGLNEEHELGLFEAGISQVGEMEHLAQALKCTIGLFTNIGTAHQEGFASRAEKIKEKLRLFQSAEVVLYRRGSEPEVDKAMDALGRPTFCWSTTVAADVQVAWEGGEACTIHYKEEAIPLRLPYTDQASFENIMHCVLLMLWLGYEGQSIAARLPRVEPLGMRLERTAGINGCLLINDSYNADLDGLAAALAPLQQLDAYRQRTAILSDILQTGLSPDTLYRQVADLLEQHRIGRVIGIGQNIQRLQALLPAEVIQRYYPDTDHFLQQQAHTNFEEEVILIKGARVFAFERIARRLSAKTHQTALEVNLSALLHNVRVYQRHLQPDTQLVVMVKAAAYGSGSLEVARALEFHQVDYLAVAYADEGIELREGGIALPIMVLNPEEAVFDSMIRYQLEPELYSLRLLRQFGQFAKLANAQVPIHLKLDTGMHRLGLDEAQLEEALGLLRAYPQLEVRTVFSHLAASGEAEHDAFTRAQVQQFERLCQRLQRVLPKPFMRHILNSSGITRFPQYQFDMVRLGIGAYGIDPSPEMQQQLQTVLSLRARISQIKILKEGDTVGYGRAGRLPGAGRTATVSIGYADGLPRSVSNGRYALQIRGQRAPIVGSVCMDMCMVDITHIPEAQEGDEVLVFGPELDVRELAKAMGTIPYEVFTSVSPRVSRVYTDE